MWATLIDENSNCIDEKKRVKKKLAMKSLFNYH